jgi:hypothetical protein
MAAESVIGALAQDIRGAWFDHKSRLAIMKKLCETIGRGDWEDELLEWNGKDGLWFRDSWSGPYGTCSTCDLNETGYAATIFTYPAIVVDDYAPDE